ncbi:unnamed protein product [Cuscuta campestris]|uniref:Uncharacterized protein n=1 Tax=Cuscuta campestris TaxID=132261 RepID=A0A484KHD6_9ASTE|nr:unnamed protein product [Cuscuta campestris]
MQLPFDGGRSARAAEKPNFAQTCNLLSQFLKGKGNLRDLGLEIRGKLEAPEWEEFTQAVEENRRLRLSLARSSSGSRGAASGFAPRFSPSEMEFLQRGSSSASTAGMENAAALLGDDGGGVGAASSSSSAPPDPHTNVQMPGLWEALETLYQENEVLQQSLAASSRDNEAGGGGQSRPRGSLRSESSFLITPSHKT